VRAQRPSTPDRESGDAVAAATGEHALSRPPALVRPRLKTPRAAAIAGILFSVLLFTAFWLLRASIPADPLEPGAWLRVSPKTVTLALNLVPFAGIAFLWFIGVVRDRLGELEDRFFATVFLGSGLLFLAMLFTAAALVGAILLAFDAAPQTLINSATFHFGRAAAFNIVNIYMIKMAGVFIVITSTVAIYTGLAPRWIAFLGYIFALFLFFGGDYVDWIFIIFPLWVLLVSLHILVSNLYRAPRTEGG
jgi:hypothetical protein